MRLKKIDEAVNEAERFLKAAKALQEAEEARANARNDRYAALGLPTPVRTPLVWGSKESGALRRASMDLTRSLADMRRP